MRSQRPTTRAASRTKTIRARCSTISRNYNPTTIRVTWPYSQDPEQATYYSNLTRAGTVDSESVVGFPTFYEFAVGYAAWGFSVDRGRFQIWSTVEEATEFPSMPFEGERVGVPGATFVASDTGGYATGIWPPYPGATAYLFQYVWTDCCLGPYEESFTVSAYVSAKFAGTDAPGCMERFAFPSDTPFRSAPDPYRVFAVVPY